MTERPLENTRTLYCLRNAVAADEQAERCKDGDAARAFRLVAEQWRDLAKLARSPGG